MSLYALILAGGSGERFWPLSRRNRPKQLLTLVSKEETLLESTIRRLDGLVPAERILILTNADQESGVRALVTTVPPENIIAEPAKRDTAAAIALGVGWISARDPQATMIVLPADHKIDDVKSFQETILTAVAAAADGSQLVTIGIVPTWPCPGFGYIEMGDQVKIDGRPSKPVVHEVKRFREKPSPELAESYLRKGNFRWNAGMFIWSIPAILCALSRHTPELAQFIERYHGSEDRAELLRTSFPLLPKISIDYAIMEKAAHVLAVEAAFDWDDVGSWPAVAKYLDKDGANNMTNTPLRTIDSNGNIVYSNQPILIGLVGVKDLIIVQTADALLVCHRHDAEQIKQLVGKMPSELQ